MVLTVAGALASAAAAQNQYDALRFLEIGRAHV